MDPLAAIGENVTLFGKTKIERDWAFSNLKCFMGAFKIVNQTAKSDLGEIFYSGTSLYLSKIESLSPSKRNEFLLMLTLLGYHELDSDIDLFVSDSMELPTKWVTMRIIFLMQ